MIQTPTQAPLPAPLPLPTSDAWLAWRADAPAEARPLSVAELSECHCPDLCNRDHPNE